MNLAIDMATKTSSRSGEYPQWVKWIDCPFEIHYVNISNFICKHIMCSAVIPSWQKSDFASFLTSGILNNALFLLSSLEAVYYWCWCDIYIYIYPCDSIVHLNLFRSDLSLPTWSMGVLAALWRSSRLILNPTAKCSRMKLQLYREIFFTFRSETRLTDSLRCLDRMTSRHIFFVKDENWNFRVRLLRQSKGGQGCGEWSIMRHLNDVNCSISVGSGAGKLFNEVSFYGFTMRWMH